MTTIIIILAVVVVFIIGIISPHLGGKIQHKTNREAHWLERCSNWLWDPLAWWAKGSLELSRKIIVKATALGKKTRKKT
jgi:hypothetical protein